MQKKSSQLIFIWFLLIFSVSLHAKDIDIQHKWKITEIIDSDGSIVKVESGDFIVIDKSTILEIMKKYGNRSYPYYREADILHVTSGDTVYEWKILFLDSDRFHLETPLGTYILAR
ncbi:hypothetical protein [Pseudoalteromonas sp.]|jgi:glutamate formiminotransferase|uniref:hypothetical protein n=1 Tax=Pseudoalteromonas sp. TaxID=53249 RepID=UPI002353D889|nr:hypothetical protein [Pseudoalteromonas sp.]